MKACDAELDVDPMLIRGGRRDRNVIPELCAYIE